MKLRNSRFGKENGCLETIGRKQLINCIFRFLKEFGAYSRYKNDIKALLNKSLYDIDGRFVCVVPVSYESFVRRFGRATSRFLFPLGTYWSEMYDLWLEWSYEEDKISSKTRIL